VRTLSLAVSALVSTVLLGCAQIPRVDVTPKVQNGAVVFDIPQSGINSIFAFEVKDEAGQTVWKIDLLAKVDTLNSITYGVVPTGKDIRASQVVPSDNLPAPDIRGKTVKVTITYQYDAWAACEGSVSRTVHVP